MAGWEFEVPGYRFDTLFRPLEQLLKPLPEVRTVFGCMVCEVPDRAVGDDAVALNALHAYWKGPWRAESPGQWLTGRQTSTAAARASFWTICGVRSALTQ